MKVNFLMPVIKDKPTKTFEFKDGKWLKVSDYPSMKSFNGTSIDVEDLKGFHDLLKVALNNSAFFIHGDFVEGTDLKKMVRTINEKNGVKATIKDKFVEIFVIDSDQYECEEKGVKAIEKFIKEELPEEFSQSDCCYQFSSSYGLGNSKLKVHLFFAPKERIHNVSLRKWAKAWNESKGEQILDSAVYTANQAVYTTKRVILGDIPDPIAEENFIGYIDRGSPLLDWKPKELEKVIKSDNTSELVKLDLSKKSEYDLSTSIRKIMTCENFHDQIRSTALSLLGKGLSAYDTRAFIEEFMQVAKRNIKGDSERLADWQLRFDDIYRAVESAVEIIDTPTFDDVYTWLETEQDQRVFRKEFAKKIMNFEGTELKMLINMVDEKTKYGARAINQDIKVAKAEKSNEMIELAKKLKKEERKANNIFEIEITPSTYGEVTANVCKILAESKKKPEVYRLGCSLAVITNSSPKTIRQITSKSLLGNDYPQMPVACDLSTSVGVIRNRVEKDCIFVDSKGKEIICPDSILNAIPKMYDVGWNPLSGIVEHPFIDNNWNLIQKQGYDKDTGLYSVLHKKLKVKLIDPKEAYDYLVKDVLGEFPFQTELDEATAVGMFMTAVQRPYCLGDSGMPGFAIVSPKPSSGKTTLAQLLSYSIYNRPVPATSFSESEEEMGKLLLSILREGHSCVLFDNLKKDSAIKSNELASAMTSGTYARRKLGVNEKEEVPSSVLWLFTGNNVMFTGDFATRILPIRLLPQTENPESRSFKRNDIGQWAIDNRKRIISAVLSIVMAGKDIKGKLTKKTSRFKEWDVLVRTPLLAVSGQDLLNVFVENEFSDEEDLPRGELLELLDKTFEGKNFKSKDLKLLCEGDNLGLSTIPVDSDGSEFREAVKDAFNDKAIDNVKTLGRCLMGMKDVFARGLRLSRGENKHSVDWRIIKIEKDE